MSLNNSSAAKKISVTSISLNKEKSITEQSSSTISEKSEEEYQQRLAKAQEGLKEWSRFTELWSRKGKEVLK